MKHYNSIDLLKFLMSFFVIAIHTAYDQVLLMRLICPWVVPMFFVISGFLLQRRISMQRSVEVCGKRVENLMGGVINSYIIKLVKLYILWTLLYLPLTFYGSCVVESNSLLRAFALFCRNVIFTGENHMSCGQKKNRKNTRSCISRGDRQWFDSQDLGCGIANQSSDV